MYIERECLSRRIFSREHKCLKINNFRVTESRFNAHITLPKPLSQDKEVYINLLRETFMRTMKKFLMKYEKDKIKMCLTDKSNNHALIGNEEYFEMGMEHTKKDKKVTLEEAMNLARDDKNKLSSAMIGSRRLWQ